VTEAAAGVGATMRVGAVRYGDVIAALRVAGLPATFTQTGGMNAAIEVLLETGHHLLITNADDSLSWNRDEQRGWGVGLYRPDSEYDDGPVVFECMESHEVAAADLLGVVRGVLASPVLRRPLGQTRGRSHDVPS